MSQRPLRNSYYNPYYNRNRTPRVQPSIRLLIIRENMRYIAQSNKSYETLSRLLNLMYVTERRVKAETDEILLNVYKAHLQQLFAAAEGIITQLFPLGHPIGQDGCPSGDR